MPHSIYVVIAALLLGSVGLWMEAARRIQRGDWPLPWRQRQTVPWRPEAVLVAVLGGYLAIPPLVTWLLAPELLGRTASEGMTPLHARVGAVSQGALLIFVPAVLALTSRCRWADFGLHREGVFTDILAGCWGFMISLWPVVLTLFAVQSLRTETHPYLEWLSESSELSTFLWVLLSAVILAPLLEELVFRVVLQQTLLQRVRPALAILIVALAFAGVHMRFDSLPLFPLALVLGYVFHRRQSYLAVVLMHALFNGVNLGLATLRQ